jgi:hypothetical protein
LSIYKTPEISGKCQKGVARAFEKQEGLWG